MGMNFLCLHSLMHIWFSAIYISLFNGPKILGEMEQFTTSTVHMRWWRVADWSSLLLAVADAQSCCENGTCDGGKRKRTEQCLQA